MLVGALVLLVVMLLYLGTDGVQALERRFYDLASTASGREPSDKVAVIAIDDLSIANIGRWPWPREVHADLIDQLVAGGAKTIAHTAFFVEPQSERALAPLRDLREQLEGRSSMPGAYNDLGPVSREQLLAFIGQTEARLDSDARLARSIREAGNVVLGSVFELGVPRGRLDAPLPAFAQRRTLGETAGMGLPASGTLQPLPIFGEPAAGIGHLNQQPDPDGAVRREPLLVDYDGFAVPSLALAVAAHSLNLGPQDWAQLPGVGLRLGNGVVPTDSAGRMLPQFYSPVAGRTPFAADSFYDVVTGRINATKYAGKIVIIGATAAGVGTSFPTPASSATAPVTLVAHSVSSLLQGHHFARPHWAAMAETGVVVLVGLYLVLLLPRLRAGVAAGVTAAACALLASASWLALTRAGWWLQFMLPLVLLLVGHLALTTRRFLVTETLKRRSDQESAETNRLMALQLQSQGQLDQAFDRLQRVPLSEAVADNLRLLAQDFERKRQFNKTLAVYEHLLRLDPTDTDTRARVERARQLAATVVLGSGNTHPGGTLVLGDGAVEQPMLGRYRVEKTLGKGAMGVVYLGRDPKIGRAVAIKTLALSAEFEGQELQDARDRFFREAETAGRLQHPNIVTIFDAGEEHDLAFIAMELLSGHDLTRHARPGDLLPPQQVLEIGEQVALALDHAHALGVVHRDIKPANIMVDPATGSVKVTDFGIARVTDSSRTKTGVVLGTPSFMAPEQLAGQRVDGRADLYSLGVTLFQLLTGRLPFQADSLAALMFRIANEPPAALTSLRPDLPLALGACLATSMAKHPAERFQTGAQMAAELRRLAARLPDAEPATGFPTTQITLPSIVSTARSDSVPEQPDIRL